MVQDFIFDGQALSDFGYIMIYENSEDVIDVSNMQYETIKAALSDEAHRVAHTYESNYTSTFFIMKNPCVYLDEDLNLTSDDIRELTRWLARKQYKWFRFIDEEDNDETWYKAQIVVQKEFYGGNCIGLQITVNTNAPYGFSREIKHIITDSPFNINVQSDEEGYIYPDMTIIASGELESGIINDGDYHVTNINTDSYDSIRICIDVMLNGEVVDTADNTIHPNIPPGSYIWITDSQGTEIAKVQNSSGKIAIETPISIQGYKYKYSMYQSAFNVEITNQYENRKTVIRNCVVGEVITISGGDNQQIMSSIDHDFTNDFNYIFPRLIYKYNNGNNQLTISGANNIKLKYRGIRKVGMHG